MALNFDKVLALLDRLTSTVGRLGGKGGAPCWITVEVDGSTVRIKEKEIEAVSLAQKGKKVSGLGG